MAGIRKGKLPETAFSVLYANEGAFSDCYFIDIYQAVSLQKYILAFYTTPLFKVERAILSLIARKHSSDDDVRELSLGNTECFSAWTVEMRSSNQILLCDITGKTRSWLMVESLSNEKPLATRLYFGSVVTPRKTSKNGRKSFGVLFHLLGGFHRLYSRALLKSAFTNLSGKKTGV